MGELSHQHVIKTPLYIKLPRHTFSLVYKQSQGWKTGLSRGKSYCLRRGTRFESAASLLLNPVGSVRSLHQSRTKTLKTGGHNGDRRASLQKHAALITHMQNDSLLQQALFFGSHHEVMRVVLVVDDVFQVNTCGGERGEMVINQTDNFPANFIWELKFPQECRLLQICVRKGKNDQDNLHLLTTNTCLNPKYRCI